MTASSARTFRQLAVIGAGNMGSGIAQKMATEGFAVVLLDLDESRVAQGLQTIDATLAQAVERKLLRPPQVERIRGRIRGTCAWSDLAGCDLVVEAVFEDPTVKRDVFAHLDQVCSAQAILATNTSSLSVTELARATRHPARVIGLHYFYHPAKNRLVEVIPGADSDPELVRAAWMLQEQLGKTPIRSADRFGFIVNRFFVPWLNEAVRVVEAGRADIPTVEAAAKEAFGVGLGPFELMNVTGVPIALHAATTLGRELGPLYAPAPLLARQVASGRPWDLAGSPDPAAFPGVARRLQGVTFHVAAELVEEGVGTREDTDIGARVGLRWPHGPFEMMNRVGVETARDLALEVARLHDRAPAALLARQVAAGGPFDLRVVRAEVAAGLATLTLDRPDAMNALDATVVEQLSTAFAAAAADPAVEAIAITGSGKAFIAGADIRFFVQAIQNGDLESIVRFTRAGHRLLDQIDRCPKPVIARLNGLALGGGLELALACDRIVASTRARVAFPETGIGIYPGLGGTQRTPRRIGAGLAKWLIYTGEMLGAEQAQDVGLIDAAVPHAELDHAVRLAVTGSRATGRTLSPALADLARFFTTHDVERIRLGQADTRGDERLAAAMSRVGPRAPLALRLAERLIDGGAGLSLEAGLQLELEHLVEIFSTADALAGLSSLGRGRPTFQGR